MRKTTFQNYLDQVHKRYSALNEGQVADYIPELSSVDPDCFGIALVTVDGHVYQSGDSREPFSIQSISKAFTYGIALEDCGHEHVATRIDVEPSGEAFNSISLEPQTGRPRNPMINAGAIVATSLVNGKTGDEKLQRILNRFEAYTGHPLTVDESIYNSEKTTGHRNRAIAHLLRNYAILDGDPEEPLDAYFRQCSILVTARDLAQMGATLANDGVNPITSVRALRSDIVPRVLSVMATCGMYDYSGNWIFEVGMPAKSGVGGGIVAVLPGQFGLAVYSPRLDAKGNSARGIAVCEALSSDFRMHMLRVTRTTTTSVIRTTYTASDVHSKLARDAKSTSILTREGGRILVMELTGELMFVSAEIVASTASHEMSGRDFLIVDLTRVAAIDRSAAALLAELMEAMIEREKTVLVTGTDQHFAFCQIVRAYFHGHEKTPSFEFMDIDRALESAEDLLLRQLGMPTQDEHCVELEKQPLCRGLDAPEMELLKSLLKRQSFRSDELICREGDAARHVYFVYRGRVSVLLQLGAKHNHRLSAVAAGRAFGESAFFQDRQRMADIRADGEVELYCLDPEQLSDSANRLAARLFSKLLGNLAELNLDRLARANEEIRILTR